jgi:hypothetical protein
MQFPMANTAYHPSGNQTYANQQAGSTPQTASAGNEAGPQPLLITNPFYKPEK